jgi:hypothetical protein
MCRVEEIGEDGKSNFNQIEYFTYKMKLQKPSIDNRKKKERQTSKCHQ